MLLFSPLIYLVFLLRSLLTWRTRSVLLGRILWTRIHPVLIFFERWKLPVIVLQPTKTAMTFRGIDLGRQANIPSETVEQVFILRMFRYMLKGFHSFDFADFRVLDFEGDSGR